MKISDEQFNDFKMIYKEQFGEDELNKISDQQLFEDATKLVNLMEILYREK